MFYAFEKDNRFRKNNEHLHGICSYANHAGRSVFLVSLISRLGGNSLDELSILIRRRVCFWVFSIWVRRICELLSVTTKGV